MESPVKCEGLIQVKVFLQSELESDFFIGTVINLFYGHYVY